METTERAGHISELFKASGGTVSDGFPAVHSPVSHTPAGTAYLKAPGVVMLAKPQTNLAGLKDFLGGLDSSLSFPAYLDDPTELPGSSQLCKTAGQLCYASFGLRRTTNERAAQYFERLTSAGHGSVLEHASFSFLLYGISRSVTHELVRHRVGVGVSQISQRYVSGAVLRFVERPEYQPDTELHGLFEERADRAAAEYETMAGHLLERQGEGDPLLDAEHKTLRPDTTLSPVGKPEAEVYVWGLPGCCLRSFKETILEADDRRRLELRCGGGQDWHIPSSLDERVLGRLATHGGPRVRGGSYPAA